MFRLRTWFVPALALAALTAGCTKRAEDTAAAPPMQSTDMPDSAMQPPQGMTASLPEGANETCPVMGKPAVAKYSAEHDGRTVYFCCGMCAPKFEADPAKYLAILDGESDAPAEPAAGEEATDPHAGHDHD